MAPIDRNDASGMTDARIEHPATTSRPAPGARVVVGLSGGVDSAVSAWLLKQQGYEVVGLFMKNWEDDDDSEHCSSRQDWIDAAAVADVIGIEIEHVNFAAEYRERVFAEFLREYQAGRTPNPDVLCNAEIKFKAFLDHALRLGAGHIATGHYARVRARGGRFELLCGLDAAKDQSYFLHRLNQAQLARTLFPVGELAKSEVRRIAAEIGLPNARKKDSTGICFIGERPFRAFLERYLSRSPGPMLDEHGREVGRHQGLSFYTLGQRQGLGIGGVAHGGGEHQPWYVAHKDMAGNTLHVVQGHDHPWLLADALHADDCSWVAGVPPWDDEALAGAALSARSRYRQRPAPCTLVAGSAAVTVTVATGAAAAAHVGAHPEAELGGRPEFDAGAEPAPGSGFRLHFPAAQWAVTPGQSAVLYAGEVCLGGGIITAAEVPALQPGLASARQSVQDCARPGSRADARGAARRRSGAAGARVPAAARPRTHPG